MKSKNKQPLSSYERAQKKVKDIKGFYGHLIVFVLVNAVVISGVSNARFIGISNRVFEDSSLLNWIDWDTYSTPIIWGVFLVMHAITVFGKNPFLNKALEERQINKYMNQSKKP